MNFGTEKNHNILGETFLFKFAQRGLKYVSHNIYVSVSIVIYAMLSYVIIVIKTEQFKINIWEYIKYKCNNIIVLFLYKHIKDIFLQPFSLRNTKKLHAE